MHKDTGTKSVRVVIVGAGFGGLWAARNLAKKSGVEVTLIDRNNYHTFIPLLYQVAAAELEPEQIAYPIRGIFRKSGNVKTVMAEVLSVDREKRLVHTDGLDYEYDHLIIATGSTAAFFNVPGAEEYTYTLKSLEDANKLRNRLLSCFEAAAQMRPEERPEGMLKVAVVGGGPTGVEYAGALMELIKTPLMRDFPEFLPGEAGVLLLDGADRPLCGFPDSLREYTAKQLKKMNVELHLNSAVAEVSATGVKLKDGTSLAAHTIVWVAGVAGTDLGTKIGLSVGKGNRINVQPTLQVAGYPEISVVGDIALVENLTAPMVAPNAIQQGTWAAKNILRQLDGQEALPFVYQDKGSMVTIGRSSGVARIGKRAFTGFFAWLLWIFVHLAFLIGFRNRLFVFVNWAWDYIFFERAVRLILPKDKSIACDCELQRKEP